MPKIDFKLNQYCSTHKLNAAGLSREIQKQGFKSTIDFCEAKSICLDKKNKDGLNAQIYYEYKQRAIEKKQTIETLIDYICINSEENDKKIQELKNQIQELEIKNKQLESKYQKALGERTVIYINDITEKKEGMVVVKKEILEELPVLSFLGVHNDRIKLAHEVLLMDPKDIDDAFKELSESIKDDKIEKIKNEKGLSFINRMQIGNFKDLIQDGIDNRDIQRIKEKWSMLLNIKKEIKEHEVAKEIQVCIDKLIGLEETIKLYREYSDYVDMQNKVSNIFTKEKDELKKQFNSNVTASYDMLNEFLKCIENKKKDFDLNDPKLRVAEGGSKPLYVRLEEGENKIREALGDISKIKDIVSSMGPSHNIMLIALDATRVNGANKSTITTKEHQLKMQEVYTKTLECEKYLNSVTAGVSMVKIIHTLDVSIDLFKETAEKLYKEGAIPSSFDIYFDPLGACNALDLVNGAEKIKFNQQINLAAKDDTRLQGWLKTYNKIVELQTQILVDNPKNNQFHY